MQVCYEKIVDSGAGTTDYMLSMGNQNRPSIMSMPDTEGCECDGQVSGSDFEAQSVCCSVAF